MYGENKIIDNELFERKHHYMFALKEIAILKAMIEDDILDEDAPLNINTCSSSSLKEINRVWNNIIIGLIREGLGYEFVRKQTGKFQPKDEIGKNDIIRITANGVHYDAKAKTLYEILKDETEVLIPEIYAVVKLKKLKTEMTKNDDIGAADTHEQTTDVVEIENEKDNNSDNADNEFTEDDFSDFVPITETERLEENALTEEIIRGYEKEESFKHISTMIHDVHKVKVQGLNQKVFDEFTVTVVPKRIECDVAKTEILVIINNNRMHKCYYSKDTYSITAQWEEQEFLIRGYFSNGEFKSIIKPAGITTSTGCSLIIDTDEYRADLKNASVGHLKYSCGETSLHVIPLINRFGKYENNNYENADVAIFFESQDGLYDYTISKNSKNFYIELNKEDKDNNKKCQIVNHWDNNYLRSEVLERSLN